MIIDCHAHLMPESWFHPKSPKSIFDLDGLFKEQDEAGVDMTVFGNNWIRSPDGANALRVVKEFNEHAAELTAKHPRRLLGLACSVPFDEDQLQCQRGVSRFAPGDCILSTGQRHGRARLRPSAQIHHRQ
jgi:hypothetical protein